MTIAGDVMETWAGWLRGRYRESGARSVTAFARQMGIPHQTVFSWLEQEHPPSLSLVLRVAAALGLPDREVLAAVGLASGEEESAPPVSAPAPKTPPRQPAGLAEALETLDRLGEWIAALSGDDFAATMDRLDDMRRVNALTSLRVVFQSHGRSSMSAIENHG